jgi:hypothetical protein
MVKTKEIEIHGKKIIIWKLNLGFKSDFEDDTTETKVIIKDSKDNKENNVQKEIKIDNGKLSTYTLVYGIYESVDLGIPLVKDLVGGFSPEEKRNRIRKIRSFEFDTTELITQINEINKDTEVDEEVIKK